MFKKIRIILSVILLVIFIGQIEAVAATHGNVVDNLNYLKDSETSELQSEINKVKEDYSLDVVIVITDKTGGKSSMNYADDYYDENGYGVGSDHSGLLMLINMEKREVWISTTGTAIGIFTDSRISDMVNHVKTLLSSGKYYDASKTFISDVKSYADMGVPNGQNGADSGTNPGTYPESYPGTNYGANSQMTYMDRVSRLIKSPLIYIIALVVSIIATVLVSVSSKGKVTINDQTYEGKGSFVISDVRDDFIRETTTRAKISKSTNNNSSGSSTHSSSSGTTHGGGGGGF